MPIPGRPQKGEAAAYCSKYIDRVPGEDVLGVLEAQLRARWPACWAASPRSGPPIATLPTSGASASSWATSATPSGCSWRARSGLPAASTARCRTSTRPSARRRRARTAYPWARRVEEFGILRAGTIAFFENLPAEAWARTGVASGNPFTVRALAYIAAGHVDHHLAVIRERY